MYYSSTMVTEGNLREIGRPSEAGGGEYTGEYNTFMYERFRVITLERPRL